MPRKDTKSGPLDKYLNGEGRPCSVCGKFKSWDNFSKSKHTKLGVIPQCKACVNKARRSFYAKLDDGVKGEMAAQSKEWHRKNRRRDWACNTLNKHKRQGYAVKINLDDMKELADRTIYCSICGKALKWPDGSGGRMSRGSPTLDRMDNEHELRPDNVWIVCASCNCSKGARTVSEFKEYCFMVYTKLSEKGF